MNKRLFGVCVVVLSLFAGIAAEGVFADQGKRLERRQGRMENRAEKRFHRAAKDGQVSKREERRIMRASKRGQHLKDKRAALAGQQ